MYYTLIDSPLDPMLAVGDGERLQRLWFTEPGTALPVAPEWRRDETRFSALREQMAAYFAGELSEFDLPLEPAGTAFQTSVWSALVRIPFGQTASYQQIAIQLDAPRAVRAVGAANGKNPIAIIVPCHRVIGSNGTLTGYAGGLHRKRWLLEHEQRQQTLFRCC